MEDVQSGPAPVALPIDSVGIRGLEVPLVVKDRACGVQHTVAVVDIGVELPAAFRGTHMSRFVQALESRTEEFDLAALKRLLEDVKTRLQARRARISFRFPYFVRKAAPATGSLGTISYLCRLTGDLGEGTPCLLLEVAVPVMTVCPCSKAISREGAHSQRATVRLELPASLTAPAPAGAVAGYAVLELDGKELDRTALILQEDAPMSLALLPALG